MLKEEELIQTEPAITLAQRIAFMKLPLQERRRILAEQAEQAVQHYEEELAAKERELWQGGDIVEL
jgi:hypothetical protein